MVLPHIIQLRYLQRVYFKQCLITDEGIKYLKYLTNLDRLSLAYSKGTITIEGLQYLSELTNMRHLSLYPFETTEDNHLNFLSCLTNLQILDIVGFKKVKGEFLMYITNLTKIHDIDLGFCSIENEGLRYITQLTRLTSLILYDCKKLDDSCSKYLKPLTNLFVLDIGYVRKLTNLEFLSHFPKLKKLMRPGKEARVSSLLSLTNLVEIMFGITIEDIDNNGFWNIGELSRLQNFINC